MSPVPLALGLLADSSPPTGSESDPPRPLSEWIIETFGEGTTAEVVSFLVEPALQILVIVVVAIVLRSLAGRFIARVVRRMKAPTDRPLGGAPVSPRRAMRADALGTLLSSIAAAVILVIAGFMILGVFGINLAPLIAGAGIIGLAIGFGAQDLVSDFLSGIFMLAEDQYGVGDFVDVGEAIGQVEGVTLRTTRVRDVDGSLWHIPNGEIRRVGNMSQQWARAVLDIGVSYDADIDQAAAVILQVAEALAADDEFVDRILEPPEILGVQDLGADSVDIRLVVKTTPGSQWGLARELRRRIKYALDDAEIEIPYPQRTVWLRTDTTRQGHPTIDVVTGEQVGD